MLIDSGKNNKPTKIFGGILRYTDFFLLKTEMMEKLLHTFLANLSEYMVTKKFHCAGIHVKPKVKQPLNIL